MLNKKVDKFKEITDKELIQELLNRIETKKTCLMKVSEQLLSNIDDLDDAWNNFAGFKL